MFLIRAGFWLSVVVLLLPAEDPPSNVQLTAETDTRVSAVGVIDAARTTVSDLASLCERSPQVCVTGEAAFDIFLRKARYGAGLVYDLMSGTQDSQPEPAATPEWPANAAGKAASMTPVPQNTLQPGDLAPEWKGPRVNSPA